MRLVCATRPSSLQQAEKEVKQAIQPDTRKRGIVLKGSFRGLVGSDASAERSAIKKSGSGSRKEILTFKG